MDREFLPGEVRERGEVPYRPLGLLAVRPDLRVSPRVLEHLCRQKRDHAQTENRKLETSEGVCTWAADASQTGS